MKHDIVLAGFLHALAAAVYVVLVTFVMTHAQAWFGGPMNNQQLGGMAILMLLVLSVAVMASLIFLRPVLWYLNGAKREALSLLASTIAFFFVLTVVVFVAVAVVH